MDSNIIGMKVLGAEWGEHWYPCLYAFKGLDLFFVFGEYDYGCPKDPSDVSQLPTAYLDNNAYLYDVAIFIGGADVWTAHWN